MAQTMIVNQVLTLAVEGRTAQDRKARLPALAAWTASPPGIVSLSVSGDALTCVVTAVAAGDCTISVLSDALPVATYDVSVLSGAATHLVINVVPT